MKPIGPLMYEHRLIEKTFVVLQKHLEKVDREPGFDGRFFDGVVDFFQVYVDKAHHGKEEEILFKVLMTKPLSDEHRRLIDELTAEHASGRELFNDLEAAVNGAASGSNDSTKRVQEVVDRLETLYTAHIEKEDMHFFYPVLEYLDRAEHDRMLENMREYDAKVLQDKYEAVIADWESAEF